MTECVEIRPFSAAAAYEVMRGLDGSDLFEAELQTGRTLHWADLAVDWTNLARVALLSGSFHAYPSGRPIGLGLIVPGGMAGLAQAAFVAKTHRHHTRELVTIARMLQARLPARAREKGLRRIECRSWANHPTAHRFLNVLGFDHIAMTPGFGANGDQDFHLYALTPDPKGSKSCAS